MPKEAKPKVCTLHTTPIPTHIHTFPFFSSTLAISTHGCSLFQQRKAAEKGEAKAKGSKSKAKGGPKRALSAYMFFSQDWRERIKTENPDAGFGEVGKLLGAKWKELSDDERKPYVEMAAKDKARAEEEKASLATGGKSGKESCGEDVGDEDDE
ncbi:non-histone chromosomal protein 6 [Pisolithus tinctorius]|nr:non-histone chromosomal protein 6 [Pisolithus tinctorius]